MDKSKPIGVLTCASLMGMASFEVLKESFETLWFMDSSLQTMALEDGIHLAISMGAIVVLKVLLLWLCNYSSSHRKSSNNNGASKSLQYSDPTLEAVAQDHWNVTTSDACSGSHKDIE